MLGFKLVSCVCSATPCVLQAAFASARADFRSRLWPHLPAAGATSRVRSQPGGRAGMAYIMRRFVTHSAQGPVAQPSAALVLAHPQLAYSHPSVLQMPTTSSCLLWMLGTGRRSRPVTAWQPWRRCVCRRRAVRVAVAHVVRPAALPAPALAAAACAASWAPAPSAWRRRGRGTVSACCCAATLSTAPALTGGSPPSATAAPSASARRCDAVPAGGGACR